METKFLAVAAGLSLVLFLAYLYGRRLRRLLWWRALIRQLECLPIVWKALTEAAAGAMVSADEFSDAILMLSEAMATAEEVSERGIPDDWM